MKIFWLVLIVHHFALIGGEQILNYSPYGVTWNEASSSCGINGLEKMEEVLRRSDVLENQQFWIGKSSIFTPWTEFIGCYKVHEMNNTEFYSINTRGECQKKCHHVKHFGFKMSSRRCVCIPDEVIFDNQKNMSACEESNFSYIYKDFLGTVFDSVDPGNCMTLCCGGCTRGSTQSHLFEARNCKAKDLTTLARCEDRTSSYWGATQHEGARFCESKQQLLLPSTFCHQTGISTFSGIQAWTNVIREHITECFETNCTNTQLMCAAGVINIINGSKIFNKIDMACNKTLQWFICRSDKSSTTDHVLFTTMSSSGMTHKQILKHQGNTNTETTIVKSKTSGVTTFEKVNTECREGFTESALIGAVIGGSVGLNLVFFGIILLIRKLRKPKLCKDTSQYADLKMETQNTCNNDIYFTVID